MKKNKKLSQKKAPPYILAKDLNNINKSDFALLFNYVIALYTLDLVHRALKDAKIIK